MAEYFSDQERFKTGGSQIYVESTFISKTVYTRNNNLVFEWNIATWAYQNFL